MEENNLQPNYEFDYEQALTTLVYDNEIPANVAEILQKKIIDKQIPINETQFNTLITNIKQALDKISMRKENPVQQKKDLEETETNHKETEKAAEIITESHQDTYEVPQINDEINSLQKKVNLLEKKLFEYTDKKTNSTNTNSSDSHLNNISKQKKPTEPLQYINNDPENIIVLMNWLQYLIDRCGHKFLNDILDYYVDIEWISQDVKVQIIEYAKRISDKEHKNKENMKKITDLPSQDHIRSYLFIQKMKGNNLDRHFINRLDDEINRLQNG